MTVEDLIRRAKHSVLHLEMRDTYTPQHPAYLDWLAGGTGRYDRTTFKDLVRELAGRGVAMRRARVVSEPLSKEIQWEHMISDENVDAGEKIRWLPRTQAFDLLLPGADFYLVDNRVVAYNFCAGDGTDTGEEVFSSAPDTVAQCLLAFEQVWERATPHADYRPSMK
ncbi:hypothetical protein DP939_10410 [Spongiactinospora rosea]|uniref:DUF6879 domain-containing protein n=1 Tax=Spongiactinospora rosea TaxID=2248750 RepID=A0A366M2V1_9ACTN|nr:hypothetical protein DP939_10410 [Spongiactinospora rosea]